jgi:hypothetical protein
MITYSPAECLLGFIFTSAKRGCRARARTLFEVSAPALATRVPPDRWVSNDNGPALRTVVPAEQEVVRPHGY